MEHRPAEQLNRAGPRPLNPSAAARQHPARPAAPPLLRLQQSVGNRAVGRLVQAKLRVSQPGDEHEREADRVADLVTAPRAPQAPAPAIGRASQPDIQRACAKCEEEEGHVHRKAAAPSAALPQAGNDGQNFAGSARASQALGRLGGGHPLPHSLRADFEPRFGHDFRDVRVHTDARAAEAARSVNALAFTHGRDVVFAAGQFSPDTDRGRWLLAHELTHVVQQGEGRATGLQRRGPWWDGEEEVDPLTGEPMEGGRLPSHRRRGLGGTLPYRQALESIIPPPRPRPAAASVQDPRQRVLPTEQAMFNDLQTYINGLPARLRALVATGSASEPWLTASNPNVQSALRVLDQLVTDMSGPNFVVRFDQPTTGNAAASWDYLNDEMHLRPYAGAAQRTVITTSLVHEYTHILQDREAQRLFARQRAPHQATRAQDLQNEIEARRQQVYFGDMLRVLGEPIPTEEIFGSRLSDTIFRGQFETERTAPTARERGAATRDIRQRLETAYAVQLTTNASIKTYAIEVAPNNHALLHWDLPGLSSPRDLGEVPRTVVSTAGLNSHLEDAVRALPEFARLFNRPGGQSNDIVTFAVVYRDEHITEFGVRRP